MKYTHLSRNFEVESVAELEAIFGREIALRGDGTM